MDVDRPVSTWIADSQLVVTISQVWEGISAILLRLPFVNDVGGSVFQRQFRARNARSGGVGGGYADRPAGFGLGPRRRSH